jgi:CheY-like chemotaxis protein
MGPGKHPGICQNVLMALFLIIEPHEDIRRLYAAVVRGLGHEVAFFDGLPLANPDVVLVEPAHAEALEAALRLQRDNPGLPIVCASVNGHSREVQVLRATTYLVKPFSLVELTDALQLALSQSDLLSEVTERVCAGRVE